MLTRSKYWFIYLLFSSVVALAQKPTASETELRKQADKLFTTADYAEAAPKYSQLLSLFPHDALLNYRYGVSLMESSKEKTSSIIYLEFATKNPPVPEEAWWYLGKAYLLSNDFTKAKNAFTQFKSTASPAKSKKLEIDLLLANCNNGLEISKSRKNIAILSSKDVKRTNFYSAYDFSEAAGKLVPTAEQFLNSQDKSKQEQPLMFITKDGQNIYYSSYGKGSGTGKDIYQIRKMVNGQWGVPENLGSVLNSSEDEDYPYLDRDGKTIYFCSRGHNSIGGYDLFKSVFDFNINQWSVPENLGVPINTTGDDYFYAPNLTGDQASYATNFESYPDEYTIRRINQVGVNNRFAIISGTYFSLDQATRRDARITVLRSSDNAVINSVRTDPKSGKYELVLPPGLDYTLVVEGGSYLPHAEQFSLPDLAVAGMRQEVKLNRDKEREQMTVSNFFTPVSVKTDQAVLAFRDAPTNVSTSSIHNSDQDSTQLIPIKLEDKIVYVNNPKESKKENENLIPVDAKTVADYGFQNNAGDAGSTAENNSSEKKALATIKLEDKDRYDPTLETKMDADELRQIEEEKERAQIIEEEEKNPNILIDFNIDNDELAQIALDDAKSLEEEALKMKERAASMKTNAMLQDSLSASLDEEADNLGKNESDRKSELKNRSAEMKEESFSLRRQATDLLLQASIKMDESRSAKRDADAILVSSGRSAALAANTESKPSTANKKNEDRQNEIANSSTDFSTDPVSENVQDDKIQSTSSGEMKAKSDGQDVNSDLIAQEASNKTNSEANKSELNASDANANLELTTNTNVDVTTANENTATQSEIGKSSSQESNNILSSQPKTTEITSGTDSGSKTINSKTDDISSEQAHVDNSSETDANTKISQTAGTNASDNTAEQPSSTKTNVSLKSTEPVNKNKNSEELALATKDGESPARTNQSQTSKTKNADDLATSGATSDEQFTTENNIESVQTENQSKQVKSDKSNISNEVSQPNLASEPDVLVSDSQNNSTVSGQTQTKTNDSSRKSSATPTQASNQDKPSNTNETPLLSENVQTQGSNSGSTGNITETNTSNPEKTLSDNVELTDQTSTTTNSEKNDAPQSLTTRSNRNDKEADLSKPNQLNTEQSQPTIENASEQQSSANSNQDSQNNDQPSLAIQNVNVAEGNDNSVVKIANSNEVENIVSSDQTKNTQSKELAVVDNTKTETSSTRTNAAITEKNTQQSVAGIPVREKYLLPEGEREQLQPETKVVYESYEKNIQTSEILFRQSRTLQDRVLSMPKSPERDSLLQVSNALSRESGSQYNIAQSQLEDAIQMDPSLTSKLEVTKAPIALSNQNTTVLAQNTNVSSQTSTTTPPSPSSSENIESVQSLNETKSKEVEQVDEKVLSSKIAPSTTSNSGTNKQKGTVADPSEPLQRAGAEPLSISNQEQQQDLSEIASENSATPVNSGNDEPSNISITPSSKASKSEQANLSGEKPSEVLDVPVSSNEINSTITVEKETNSEGRTKLIASAPVIPEKERIELDMKEGLDINHPKYPEYTKVQEKITDKQIETINLFAEGVNLNKQAVEEKQEQVNLMDSAQLINDEGARAGLLAKAEELGQASEKHQEQSKSMFTASQSKTRDVKSLTVEMESLKQEIKTGTSTADIQTPSNSPSTKPSAASTGPNKQSLNEKVAMTNNSGTSNTTSVNSTTTSNSSANSNAMLASNELEKFSFEKFSISRGPAYNSINPIPLNPGLPEGLVFKVQVGAFHKPIPDDSFKNLQPVSAETTRPGWIRYCVGMFKTFEPANLVKKELRKTGYKDAFVVAYFNGKRISLQEANAMLNREENQLAYNGEMQKEISALRQLNVISSISKAGAKDKDEKMFYGNASAPSLAEMEDNGILEYSVQVGVYRTSNPPLILNSLEPLYSEALSKGLYRFTSGRYSERQDAELAKNNAISTGITDAFVVAIRGNKNVRMPAESRETISAPKVKDAEISVVPVVKEAPVSETSTSTEKLTGIRFRVQLGAFRQNVPFETVEQFLKISDKGIERVADDRGLNIFYAGSFDDFESARILKEEIVEKGVKDAFIVALSNGKRVPLSDILPKGE